MNETTLSYPPTADEGNENTTLPHTLPVPTEYPIDLRILIGASAGSACAVIIIIILIVCCIKSRHSHATRPPMLPHPYSMHRFESNEPSISDHHSDLQAICANSKRLDSMQHIWEAREPIIHSPTDCPEADRVSYIWMSEPTRPISMSPPSPEQAARGSQPVSKKRPSPMPCKGTSGYINIPRNRSGRSPASPAPLRNPSNTSDIAVDDIYTTEDKNNLDNYQNVQESMLADSSTAHNTFTDKEKSLYSSYLSREIPENRLPDLLTSTRLHKDLTKAQPVQNPENAAVGHPGDASSSDGDAPASHEDVRTSYVNAEQYKKRSPVKESVVIGVSKSPFPELGHGNNAVLESRSKTKANPSSLLPRSKLAQQQQPTITITDDTYHINTDLYGVDKSRQNNLSHKHRKLSSPTRRNNDIDSSTYGPVSPPATENTACSASTQFLTTGRIQKKKLLKGVHGRKNRSSRSQSFQEDAGVYQNFMAISLSDSKLSQETPTSPASSNIKDIHSRATNDSDTAAEFHPRKPQFHLNGKMDQTEKTTPQPASPLSGLPRSRLKDTKFGSSPNVGASIGSSPNVGGSDEINDMRSKLRKVN